MKSHQARENALVHIYIEPWFDVPQYSLQKNNLHPCWLMLSSIACMTARTPLQLPRDALGLASRLFASQRL